MIHHAMIYDQYYGRYDSVVWLYEIIKIAFYAIFIEMYGYITYFLLSVFTDLCTSCDL